MKLEWTESESDYGLEEAAFYEGPPAVAPPPTKHVSFSLRLDLCDEGGGAADGIKTEPPEAEEPRAMQKVPSLSDLSDPEASLDIPSQVPPLTPGTNKKMAEALKATFASWEKEQLRLGVPKDPRQWNEAAVAAWLRWAAREFSLEGVALQQFARTQGKDICAMGREEFVARAPAFMGDILWEHLEILQKDVEKERSLLANVPPNMYESNVCLPELPEYNIPPPAHHYNNNNNTGGYTTGGPRETNAYGYSEASGGGAPAPTAASPLDDYYPPEYPPGPPAPPAQPYIDEYYHHAHAHSQPLLTHEPKYQPHAYTKPYPRGGGGRYGGEGYGESYGQEYGGACAEWNEWPADQHALIPQDKLAYPATGPCFTGSFQLSGVYAGQPLNIVGQVSVILKDLVAAIAEGNKLAMSLGQKVYQIESADVKIFVGSAQVSMNMNQYSDEFRAFATHFLKNTSIYPNTVNNIVRNVLAAISVELSRFNADDLLNYLVADGKPPQLFKNQ